MKSVRSLLALSLSPYPWLASAAFDPKAYAKKYEVPLSGVTIHWTVTGDSINLALQSQTTGFIAMGLAEPTVGGMAGADILVAKVEGGVASIEDRVATAKSTPDMDTCQDWVLVSGEEVNGMTVVEVTRKLDTGDEQDRRIMVGATAVDFNNIIVARGDSDTFGYHGSNRWTGRVHFGGYQPPTLENVKKDCCKFECTIVKDQDPVCNPTNNQDANYIKVMLRNNAIIPSQVTTYEDAMYSFAGLLKASQIPNGQVHIVGMEAIIQEETKEFVHHFTILDGSSTMWAWVPGNGPYVLPDEAGIRLHADGATAPNALIMQTHFDNPSLKSGIKDQSGIDLYVTTTLRANDAGMMVIGDGRVQLEGEVVGDQQHIFDCPKSCTDFTQELTVIGNMFHMHKWGQQMWTTQTRDGQVVDEWRADYYDYAFENYYNRPRTIRPGDALRTTCVYKNAAAVTWGLASSEEMCMDFVAYYPKQTNTIAGAMCGHPSTCGSYTKGPSGREKISFGQAGAGKCGNSPTPLPGDSPTPLPGDSPTPLPGDSPTPLPGDSPTPLDGDKMSAACGTFSALWATGVAAAVAVLLA